MRKGKTRWWPRLAVAFVAGGLSLWAAELYFRLAETIPATAAVVAALPAGVPGTAFDEEFVRSVGERPIWNSLAERRYGIICLGQSFTYGTGVPDTQTYPFHLQLLLNRGKFLGPYRAYNFGSAGTGLVRQAHVYEEFAPRLPHALVVLTYLERDEYVTLAEAKGRSPVARALQLRKTYGATAASRRVANAYYMKWQEANADPEETPEEARAEFSRWFARLAADVRRNDARLLVVMVGGHAAAEGYVRGLCAKGGAMFHRQDFSNENDAYRLADGHFNGRGNRRLAEQVIGVLRANRAV